VRLNRRGTPFESVNWKIPDALPVTVPGDCQLVTLKSSTNSMGVRSAEDVATQNRVRAATRNSDEQVGHPPLFL
jgi:hypothetical protein